MQLTIEKQKLTEANSMAKAISFILMLCGVDFRFSPVYGENGFTFKINVLNHAKLSYFHIGKESVLISAQEEHRTRVVWYGFDSSEAINLLFTIKDMLIVPNRPNIQIDKETVTINKITLTKKVERPSIFNKMRKLFSTLLIVLLFAANALAQMTDNFVTHECLLALQVNQDTTKTDNVAFGTGSENGVDYNVCQFTFSDDVFQVNKTTGEMWHYATYSRTIHYTDCRFDFKGIATRTIGTDHKTWYEFDFVEREVRHYINGALARTFKADEQSEKTVPGR